MMRFDLNLFLTILFFVFCAIAAIQVLYYLLFFSRIVFHKRKKSSSSDFQPPLSVVICAKNELENLQKNLIGILEQNYPKFEVIVSNDNSKDGTDDFLVELKTRYPHLKVVNIFQESRTFKGKRLALSLGLKAAQYEWCILTDADCAPSGSNWLSNFQRNFKDDKEIVLGYAPHYKLGGFLNKCIRFETFFTAFQYLNFAMSGIPYMGVGRNMAYKKNLFFDNKGYLPQPNVISGDDDLFINKVAFKKNTAVEINAGTFMYSMPKTTWTNWFLQKRRHISTGKMYRPIHLFLLGLQSFTQLSFYALLLVLLAFQFQWKMVLIIYGVRFLLQGIDFGVAMRKLKEMDLFWLFPVLDVFQLFYNLALLPSLIKKPDTKWK
jgi:glycosyltransferase involved in cell wall biosynthesis